MSQQDFNVCVVGGTHGNELTGIHLIHQWQRQNKADQYCNFNIEYLLANPAAKKANKRYLEKDLNRCFKRSDLEQSKAELMEQQRANAINHLIGPKGDPRVDFIIDLHTSTANMQTNIVLIKHDPFHLNLAAYLLSRIPDAVITSEKELMADHHFLCSIADKGIVIEVGPVSQGALEYDVYNKTEIALQKTLDFIVLWQKNQLPAMDKPLEIMSYFDKCYFPTDDFGEINAVVHPKLIHQDFSRIKAGDPLFISFEGEIIPYDGEPAWIAFVNEAAYYDQKIALCLCHQKYIDVPPMPAWNESL